VLGLLVAREQGEIEGKREEKPALGSRPLPRHAAAPPSSAAARTRGSSSTSTFSRFPLVRLPRSPRGSFLGSALLVVQGAEDGQCSVIEALRESGGRGAQKTVGRRRRGLRSPNEGTARGTCASSRPVTSTRDGASFPDASLSGHDVAQRSRPRGGAERTKALLQRDSVV